MPQLSSEHHMDRETYHLVAVLFDGCYLLLSWLSSKFSSLKVVRDANPFWV